MKTEKLRKKLEQTITGADWARALPAARKRRKGAAKRIRAQVKCTADDCHFFAHGVRRVGRAKYLCACCGKDVSMAVVFLTSADAKIDLVTT